MKCKPRSIEKCRTPLELVLRALRLDQVNKSCAKRNCGCALPRCDPRPSTSSISCSVNIRASAFPADTGRVNCNGLDELSVMTPSYAPLRPRSDGSVLRPRVRPPALFATMLAVKGLVGNVAIAVMSLAVFASAFRAVIYVFQSTP